MSKIITERELMQNSQLPDAGGVVPFGYEQVNEALRLWCEMLPQERRQLAERMAAHDAPAADEFVTMLIDAVFDTGYHDGLMIASEPGSERHERIEKMLKSVMAESDGNDPKWLEI